MQIDSKNIKICITSDHHNESAKLRKILSHEAADINIFLGDHFHSFYNNTKQDTIDTCNFYNEFVNKDNFINLWGNHCTSQLYPSIYTSCSGWTKSDSDLALSLIDKNTINKTKWFCWVDDFLCTHSGLHPYFLPPMISLNKKEITEFLNKESQLAQKALEEEKGHWFFAAGRARGGNQKLGGLTWLDFNQEVEPINGILQIAGHTSGNRIRSHHTFGGLNVLETENICIDCHLNEYLTITNGKMEIKKFIDL